MGAGPPGSAGVPPACTAVACRSVSLRWAARHPAGRNRMGSTPPGSAWAGLRPAKPARSPLRSKSNGSRPTRERGRPARMHCRSVPLSFPAMAHPATLPAGTAWARPKQGLTPPGSAWAGLRPPKPARSPLRSKSNGSRSTRERGRPARMHCRSVPLSFPAMGTRHPAGRNRMGSAEAGPDATRERMGRAAARASRHVPP